jgi:autotransporter-associated beta strand protein
LTNVAGNNTFSGAVNLGSSAVVNRAAGNLTQSGILRDADEIAVCTGEVIEGPGGLDVVGDGALTLTRANEYTGLTTVSDGVLNIRNNQALGTTLKREDGEQRGVP